MRRSGEVQANPESNCDVELYHLGNNQLHREIYRRALARPGVVVLHDAVLQHFFLGSLREDSYVEEFVYCYGEWARGMARELYRNRAQSAQGPEYFRFGMLRRIAETSRAVIVHNAGAARRVKAEAPSARVIEIPHLYVEPPAPKHITIGARFSFGVFGYLRESKQLLMILRVFARLRSNDPGLRLLVAGPFASSDLERACAGLLSGNGVERAEYLPEAEFFAYAQSVDCCINLREPPAGETSGIAIRLMGLGKAVIVTDGEEVSSFPADICARVDSGLGAEEMLEATMLLLSRNPDGARRMGEAARAHVRSVHAINLVAEQYWKVIASVE
jgi:glycosyltransferase involved in cell wall biosynthesis